jgi:hypothetical protein
MFLLIKTTVKFVLCLAKHTLNSSATYQKIVVKNVRKGYKMMKPKLTEDLARRIATDAADRQMRADNRSAWSAQDYNLAAETFNKLYPEKEQTNEDNLQNS